MDKRKLAVAIFLSIAVCVLIAVIILEVFLQEDLETSVRDALSQGESRIVALSYRSPFGQGPYSGEGQVEVEMFLPDYYMKVDTYGGMPSPWIQTGRESQVIGEMSSSPIGPNLARMDSVTLERTTNIPPIRGQSSLYLSQYMLFGNGAYYHTLLYLLESGKAEVTGKSNIDGKKCYVVEVGVDGPGRSWELHLEEEYGLPLRLVEREEYPEQTGISGYEFETDIYDLEVNPGLRKEDFSVDIVSLYNIDPAIVTERTTDMMCLETTPAEFEAMIGFSPLLPEVEGFDLYGVYYRDWSAYQASTGFDPSQVPEGYFECYLILRDPTGTDQVEIMEAREGEGMGIYYSEEPMGYYISREDVEVDGGTLNVVTCPFYQMGTFKAGDMRVTVTGDMSYEQLVDIAESMLTQEQ